MKQPLVALSAVAALSACSTAPAPSTEVTQVAVNVTYRERIILPPGHVLKVSVEDISLADAPSVTMAQSVTALEGRAPPYSVTLQVPTANIKPIHSYAARAEIRDSDGKLRFTTDTHYGVLTRRQPNTANIVLIGVP